MGSGHTSLGGAPPFLALAALWEQLVGGWAGSGRFGTRCTGWRRGLSITFCVDTRNGGSTQRCPFGHDRFLEGTEKLDIQTRESTDDAFAVALRKMGLDKSSGSHVKGDTYEEEVLEVG